MGGRDLARVHLQPSLVMMGEFGAATTAVLAIARDFDDERVLAERICRACVQGLHVDGAALSLLTAQIARHTVHATDPTAQMLEELQFGLGEGVCMEAAITGRPVFVADVCQPDQVQRWPVFAAAVIERTSVRALCALPLQWGATNLGVIDLYRSQPVGLSDAQRRDAIGAVNAAALMMVWLRTRGAKPSDVGVRVGARAAWGGLWEEQALSGHAVIHQATGMVLAQLRVSAADALARMRAYAFMHQLPLTAVAQQIVDRRLDFTAERVTNHDPHQ